MEPVATPDFFISPMRLLDMPEITFFYTTSQPIPFADLDKVLDPLIDSSYAAKVQANLVDAGPNIVRYFKVDSAHPGDPDLYRMEVGVEVKPEVKPAGEAQVKTLPSYHCASLLLWGGLTHITQAYESLMKAMKDAGLQHTGECREVTYYFERVDSSNNLMGLYMEVC